MKHFKKEIYAGLALLGALIWISPAHLGADTTTQPKSGVAVKHRSRTTPQRRSHKASVSTPQRHAHQASATAGQHRSTHRTSNRHLSARARAAAARRRRAQLRPEPTRIEEIQQALAQAGYFNGQPNGLWDDRTREAMRHYQADHGFPATGLPEAKSLMKLGLGPHPLPPELDASNGGRAGTDTASHAPATPDAPRNPPTTTTPQP